MFLEFFVPKNYETSDFSLANGESESLYDDSQNVVRDRNGESDKPLRGLLDAMFLKNF